MDAFSALLCALTFEFLCFHTLVPSHSRISIPILTCIPMLTFILMLTSYIASSSRGQSALLFSVPARFVAFLILCLRFYDLSDSLFPAL